jgi:FixJ family two-component response regulator
MTDDDRVAIDCMLVDVNMPGLSGIDLQTVLNEQADRTPAMIFMTSYRDERTRAAAMDGGAFGFLGKPVDFHQLVLCLEEALNH